METTAYLIVPVLVHRNRARALLAEGKVDEAMKEIETCLTTLPGDVEIPIQLTAALTKHGRKPDAEKIFDRVYDVYQQLCKDYPNSAWGHNSAAWMAACCRRNLDDALAHAEKATSLSPESAGYFDTLAEVQFQRGQTAKSIELMKKCLTMEPNNTYFQKQLARFQKGDPTVDVPSEENDGE